jgi:hypothetical protein
MGGEPRDNVGSNGFMRMNTGMGWRFLPEEELEQAFPDSEKRERRNVAFPM